LSVQKGKHDLSRKSKGFYLLFYSTALRTLLLSPFNTINRSRCAWIDFYEILLQ